MVLVKQIVMGGMPVNHVVLNGEARNCRDFKLLINTRLMFCEDDTDSFLQLAYKIISVLEKYPQRRDGGIEARFYFKQELLSVGFSDHLGNWEPSAVNRYLSQIAPRNLGELLQELEAEIANEYELE